MSNSKVRISSKLKVFEAVMRSVMCYGAQVWGGKCFDDVEKLLRFFLKKLFKLPSNTPNYLLEIESGISPLFLFTLKLNMKYVSKVVNEEDGRLTKLLVQKALRTRTLFYKDWENISTRYNVTLDLRENNIPEWNLIIQNFVREVEQAIRAESVARAESSTTRLIYRQLNHQPLNYLNSDLSTAQMSMIIRVRGELLNLNHIPHREDLPQRCSLCNTGENEGVMHFLGTCPILKEIRRNHYGVDQMTIDAVKCILDDSENWTLLVSYCSTALRYRTRILNEDLKKKIL